MLGFNVVLIIMLVNRRGTSGEVLWRLDLFSEGRLTGWAGGDSIRLAC